VAGDRAASWLPLYHDMGLIGFLMAPLSTSSRSTT
jgi:fatty-acyl-CoA synthase